MTACYGQRGKVSNTKTPTLYGSQEACIKLCAQKIKVTACSGLLNRMQNRPTTKSMANKYFRKFEIINVFWKCQTISLGILIFHYTPCVTN